MAKQLGGSIPHMVRNGEGPGYKRLFFSRRDQALIKDKTLAPGYGVLAAGTIMAENISAAGNKGLLVPYVPVFGSMVLGADSAIGVAPMVANGATGFVYVSNDDAAKFVIGDELYYQNTAGDGLVACGAISAIAVGTLYATITVAAYVATNATVAKGAYVFVKSGLTPFSTAKYMLDSDVDTGVGEDAEGALAPVFLSNAIIYTASMVNATTEAIAALGGVVDGPHIVFK